jgi:hypothetical protein
MSAETCPGAILFTYAARLQDSPRLCCVSLYHPAPAFYACDY